MALLQVSAQPITKRLDVLPAVVMVQAFSHRPLWQRYTEDAAANDKRFAAAIMAALPMGGLLVFDLGFFSFLWFDDFTDQQKFFVTRMRQKIAYRTVQVLSQIGRAHV